MPWSPRSKGRKQSRIWVAGCLLHACNVLCVAHLCCDALPRPFTSLLLAAAVPHSNVHIAAHRVNKARLCGHNGVPYSCAVCVCVSCAFVCWAAAGPCHRRRGGVCTANCRCQARIRCTSAGTRRPVRIFQGTIKHLNPLRGTRLFAIGVGYGRGGSQSAGRCSRSVQAISCRRALCCVARGHLSGCSPA